MSNVKSNKNNKFKILFEIFLDDLIREAEMDSRPEARVFEDILKGARKRLRGR